MMVVGNVEDVGACDEVLNTQVAQAGSCSCVFKVNT